VERDFFVKVVEFAREHRLMVVHDFAYADFTFDGYKPPSFLSVPGAKDVGVEIFSLSKSYNMPGWRMGFVCGNARMIAALARIKSYLDYGAFQPIQIASIIALEGDQKVVDEIVEVHRKRRDVLVDGLNKLGWEVPKPKGTMFVWAPSRSRSAPWAPWSSPSSASRKRRSRYRLASGSASTAKATSASRSSRTSSGSSRRCAASSTSTAERPDDPPVTSVGEVHIGLLGLGTVGAGVVKILQSQRAMLEERAGCRLALAAVADTDLTRAREGLDLRALPMTNDAARVLGDPGVHVVIELVGGLEPARTFILRALAAGKHVVTANKALLAHHGAELYEEARRRGVTLAFEAAVAGGIPLIRPVNEGRAANSLLSLAGIVNGACNYILSTITDEGIDFSLVLKEAQAQGYAEADPTLDIEGMDSAHKLQILVSLAFRTFIDLKDIHTEGIARVTAADIAYARELGYRIKLLAIATA